MLTCSRCPVINAKKTPWDDLLVTCSQKATALCFSPQTSPTISPTWPSFGPFKDKYILAVLYFVLCTSILDSDFPFHKHRSVGGELGSSEYL